MDSKIRNLESLSAEYRHKGNALNGYNILSHLIEIGENDKISHLLRNHLDESVELDELKQRFEIDALIEYYNLCFVAALAGFIDPNLNEPLRLEIVKILSHPSVVKYYTNYYPYFLTSITLRYATNCKQIEKNTVKAETGLFYSFLMLNKEIKNDDDVECFMNMLDYVNYSGDGIKEFMKVLRSKTMLPELLQKKEKSPLTKSIWGFFKYSEFLNSFKELLEKANGNKILQSGFWLYHGYYFDRIGNNVIEIFTEGFDQIALNIADNFPEIFQEIDDEGDIMTSEQQKQTAIETLTRTKQNIMFVLNSHFKNPLSTYFIKINNRGKALFKVGDRISLKRNISQKGRVDFVLSPQGGYQFYDVMFDNGRSQTVPENDLLQEVLLESTWDLLANNSLKDYRYFSIATTIHKVQNTTSNTISTLKASRTVFKPYQYKPLVKFLKSDLRRILIADEVGLGKTIEAGHVMLEMTARGNLRNALVICTKALSDKWKNELQNKFNFIFKKYESTSEFIQDIRNDVAGSRKSILGILNYEKCRNEQLQKIIEENNYHFDLLICDEAHKIRNSETAQHKGIAKIVDQSDAVIFMTATPIMTDIKNLHSLIRVIDRQGYDTFDIFNNAVNQNRPFIKALSQLNENIKPLHEIADQLQNTKVVQQMTADEEVYSRTEPTIGELFKNDALYNRAMEIMRTGNKIVENRVKIQQDLIELNSLNHIYTRTRKKDVLTGRDIVKRMPHTYSIDLTDEEQFVYDAVINEYSDPNSLGLIQRKRQMSSCIVAFRTPKEELENGRYNMDLVDSKFNMFRNIINEVVIKGNKKLIVFAFFTNTLLYLKIKLNELGIESEIIYGSIQNRTERIERFQHEEKVKVLLSSEVGSEGIDLQFCDALVNYDLPWNPMVVEQRIGRIDRVGQKSELINIYNLIINNTIESRIYTRLYERINLFKESIGDLEEILGEKEDILNIEKLIENIYRTELTVEEENKKLDQGALALETEKQYLEKVQTELQSAFANDLHFKNEIDSIINNHRYITKEEIIKYLESIISEELSSIQINHVNENISELLIPSNSKLLLFDFIEKYKDSATTNPEIENIYKKFKSNYFGAKTISFTFNQEYAFENKKVEYISAFHPLINAITNYFQKSGFEKNQAHKIALERDLLAKEKQISAGFYILVIYNISVMKEFGDGRKNQLHFLQSALADINGENIELLDTEISDHVFGMVQLYGEKFQTDFPLDKQFVDEVRPFFAVKIYTNEQSIKEDEEIKFLSGIRRRAEQELNYIDKRLERIEGQLIEKKGIEAILKKEIENLNLKKEQLIFNEKNAKIETNQSLISINLLQIL